MHHIRLRRPTRARGILLGGAMAVLLAFPVGVLAGATFNDVPTSHPFYNDIEALVASGVTAGCGGGNYCPNANVTRAQMAAFMNRLGALQAGKTPVVNAAKLQGSLPSVGVLFLDGSTNAQTPTTVDSFTVTAPGPGTLLIEVMGDIWVNADAASASSLTTSVNWGICTSANSSATCGNTYWDTHYQDADDVSSNNATPGSGRARVVAVSAAGPQTFYLNAQTTSSSHYFSTYNTYAVVTFVPGASPLSVTSTSVTTLGPDSTDRQGE